ncbi:MAG: folylpolyglutamate synthase/dihydrofolate synthase family protein [Flavobacteriales bacterium]
MKFTQYEEVLDYLFAQLPMYQRVGPAAYKPDLSNTIALLEIVGNPQHQFKSVHVAGTNGKGSTSHLIASSLQEAGYKTGLTTSPHLKDFRERIKINGAMIPHDDVILFVNSFSEDWQKISPSFFEMSVALAFWYFAKEKVDIAVIETGLGGRLDSTNVVVPEVTAITNVGWDHVNLLGDTLEKIAAEKAGIIKQNIPVVLGEMKPNVHSVMIEKASSVGASIIDASLQSPEPPPSALLGNYQKENRRTAFQVLQTLNKKGWNISQKNIEVGFSKVIVNTSLMGRWQILSQAPLTIADVGHNKDGIEQIIAQLAEQQFDHLHFVIAMVNDKDIRSVLELLPKEATYYFSKAQVQRGLEASILKAQAEEVGLSGNTYSTIEEAFQAAKEKASQKDLIFIGGSVFTVAEVL